MTTQFYETERLILKPTDTSDGAFILKLYNSPKWLEHIGDRNLHTITEAEQYIEEKMMPQLERLGFSNNTVILKATGEKIGVCGLYDREGLDGLDIGFAFLPEYEKKGYGFESAQFLLKLAFEKLGYQKVSAITTHQNIDSQHLIEKLGFQHIDNIRIPNDDEELRLYVIEKTPKTAL